MATSGAMNTDNTYVKYTIEVIQNSQSIANNTSNVTVKVRFYRTNSGYSTYGTGTVYCKINDTTYSASVTPSQKITSSGIVLITKTVDVPHNSDGTKSLATSAWISHNELKSSEQSYSQTLTTIPRKSSLSAGNGTLGTAQTLTVTRQSSSITHTVTYKCGSASGTIVSSSSSTSISFTPPLTLASQNTSGTSVPITYTITSYSGSTSVGSDTYTKSCSIPSSVAPTCSIAITDATGYATTYGGFLKGLSKFKVVVTPTTSYSSAITSYSVTANGSMYNSATSTTEALKTSGTLSVTATVVDKRGRSGKATKTQAVLDYVAPILSLSVMRCNSDGTENDQGEYTCVKFSSEVTSLSNKNKATYTLNYKKSSASTYTKVALTSLNNVYTTTKFQYVIPTSSNATYNISVTVADAFNETTKSTSISTGFTLIHWLKSGLGMAIGKVAEKDNVFDIGLVTQFRKKIIMPENVYGSDGGVMDMMNSDMIGVNTLYWNDTCQTTEGLAFPKTGTPTKDPNNANYDFLRVLDGVVYIGATAIGNINQGKSLWSGGAYVSDTQTITPSTPLNECPNGWVLCWSRYSGGAAVNDTWQYFPVMRTHPAMSGGGITMYMLYGSFNLANQCSKYVYVTNTTIVGHSNNAVAPGNNMVLRNVYAF